MTTEQAIKLLHRLQDEQFDGIHGDERREALEMAVRALESNLVKESDGLVNDLVKDCISRKMAIDALDGFRCGTKAAWKVIEDLPSAQQYWIPCSERLPREDEDVLLQFSSNMGVGFYRDGWAVNTGEGIYSVVDISEEKPIAWMPLPKPYGGESE